jgi:hypothetical protein
MEILEIAHSRNQHATVMLQLVFLVLYCSEVFIHHFSSQIGSITFLD